MPYLKAAARNKLHELLKKLGVVGENDSKKLLEHEQYYDDLINLTNKHGYHVVPQTNEIEPTKDAELQLIVDENKREFATQDLIIAFSKTILRMGCRENVFSPDKGTYDPQQPVRFPDSKYQLLPKDTLMQLLYGTNIDKIKYKKEVMDCDDFSRALVQRCSDFGINSMGYVFSWSGGHSFNVAAVYNDDDNIEFVFIESQTDRIITELTGQYDISNALMII